MTCIAIQNDAWSLVIYIGFSLKLSFVLRPKKNEMVSIPQDLNVAFQLIFSLTEKILIQSVLDLFTFIALSHF